MKLEFDVSTQEFLIMQEVLQRALPCDCKVWVFGSRAKYQTKHNSDVDLAIDCQRPLDPTTRRKLNEGFDESHLPYRVDVVDMHKVSDNFKTIIDKQKVAFPFNSQVPKLRFPEFEGEWEESNIGNIATLQRGFDLPSSKRKKGVHPVVSSGGITDYHSEYKVTAPGVITGRYGSIGCFFYLDKNYWPLNTSLWVKDFHDNNEKFIFYFLSKINLIKLSDKTGVPGINRNDVHRLKAYFPINKIEQQKIANFLTAVDKRISQLEEKKRLLTEYKKGVMQQIFSQHIRFKDDDGKAYPDWEEKRLGEVATINPKSNELPCEFYYIDLESVSKGVLSHDSQTICKEEAPSRAQRFLEKGDILFQMVRPYQRNNYLFFMTGTYVASTGYAQIRVQSCPEFIYQHIHIDGFVNEILRRCTGTSYPAINSSDLEAIKVGVPTLEEQQKIADFLTAIDRKIERVGAQLGQAKAFKKGLLQQIFV